MIATTQHRNPLRRLGDAFQRLGIGIVAVGTKELRGRMRGRRAFAVLTLYLVLLAIFSWGVYEFQKDAAASQSFFTGFGVAPVALAAQIGQALFTGLLLVETVLVAVLAPAFTTGAISLEREKQTLDLLVTTPLSSLGLVIGKLGAALAYVFLLIFASLPMAAVVFLFGGVGPDDLLRGYLLLVCFAVGFGAIGLFISALVKRTQVATVLTYLTILALTAGTWVVWYFLYATSGVSAPGGFIPGTGATSGRPAQQLLWLNPFVADMDLVCVTAVSGSSDACLVMSAVTGKPYFGSSRQHRLPARPVPASRCPSRSPCRASWSTMRRPPSRSGWRTRSPSAASLPTARARRTPGASSLAKPAFDVAPIADPDGLPARHVLAAVRRRIPDPGGGADAHLVAPGDAQPSGFAPAPLATRPEARTMTLDPTLVAIRSGLAPFRRRLWLRRIVRDATWLAAVVVGLELVLAVAGRLVPLGWAWSAALAIPVVGVVALLIDAVRVRPTIAETALALDGEQGLRDRLSSALEIALRSPELTMTVDAGDAPDGADRTTIPVGRCGARARDGDLCRLRQAPASRRAGQPARGRPSRLSSPIAAPPGARGRHPRAGADPGPRAAQPTERHARTT